MGLEVECKIYLADVAKGQRCLEAAGAEMSIPRVFEQNTRYENAGRDLVTSGQVLRLRQDQRVRLTYKSPALSSQAGVTSRLELETAVDDFATMDAILQQLGFWAYMTYEKYRTTYHIPDLADTEIVLDEMPYGVFIEVEGTEIEAALQRLGLAGERRILASYSELFERVRQRYGLTFHDLTFANFAGIAVAPEVFFEGAS